MIDSHCHLADEVFAADLDAVVARAKTAGLERVMVILEAGNQKEAEQAAHVERLWPETRFAIGVHPHQAHQFADDPERTAALDLGFYISLAGIITFPKAAELRDTARAVPIDRLLTETDSPFLAPVPHRGKRNEPAHVAAVVAALAELYHIDAGELARRTTA